MLVFEFVSILIDLSGRFVFKSDKQSGIWIQINHFFKKELMIIYAFLSRHWKLLAQ